MLPVVLDVLLYALHNAGRHRAKGSCVEVDMCGDGWHFLANTLYVGEVGQGMAPLLTVKFQI